MHKQILIEQRNLPSSKHLIIGSMVNPRHRNISQPRLCQTVIAKLGHTFKNRKTKLYQITLERDDLQYKLEQQEEEASNLSKWEQILHQDIIEEPENAITSTMKNLAPPISIFQYYQAFKPFVLIESNLRDIWLRSKVSKEQFKAIWSKANPTAKDLLVFMWILKDLITTKGTIEITTADLAFYATRFCTKALIHISQHHNHFYSNTENWSCLPQIEPYDHETTREIQEIVIHNFSKFFTALDILAQEDTTQLHEATLHHQNMMRKYPDSFPITFHKIQLHGYITRALEDRRHTLEQLQISTPHAKTLLYLPQYDPGSMEISKRS